MKMKKTLAILLALIMSTSVALVACNNSSDDNGDDGDFVVDWDEDLDFDGGETDAPETDENGETIKAPENTNTNNGGSSSTNTNVQQVSDTVYALYDTNIRKKAGTRVTTNTSEILGKIPFGSSASRTEIVGYWSKITYKDANGKTIEGYVSNQLITNNVDHVTFLDEKITTGEGENQTTSSVVSKFKPTNDGKNYILRSTPLAPGKPHAVDWVLEEKGVMTPDTEVTVLAVSKDREWAKISVPAGKVILKDDKGQYVGSNVFSKEVYEGYVPYSFLAVSESGSSTNQPSGGNAAG